MKYKLLILFAGLGCICMMACGNSADEVVGFDDGSVMSVTEDFEVTERPEATQEPEVQEEEGNCFLKGQSKDLLSFEEVHFFGNDTRTLSVDSAKKILENKGLQVSIEESKWDYTSIDGYFPQNGGTSITMWKYDSEEYVSSWSFVHRPERTGKTVEVGARDICMHDSVGEVLKKIGFQNAFEAEQELKLLVGDTSIHELPEARRLQIENMFDFSKSNSLFVEATCGVLEDEFSLLIWDRASSETLHDYVDVRFARSKETDGEYVLVQFSVHPKINKN